MAADYESALAALKMRIKGSVERDNSNSAADMAVLSVPDHRSLHFSPSVSSGDLLGRRESSSSSSRENFTTVAVPPATTEKNAVSLESGTDKTDKSGGGSVAETSRWIACGCPTDWAAGVATLQTMPPQGFPAGRWEAFQKDATRFCQEHAANAAAAGWHAVELFGLSRRAPWHNWRGFGLVPLLNGAAVTGVDTDAITMRTGSGSAQSHRRRPVWPDAVPAWELAG
jgi:hypothetical protein